MSTAGTGQLTFDEWWDEFLRQEGAARDPSGGASALVQYLAGLPADRRRPFQRELVRVVADESAGWSLAAEALVDVDADLLAALPATLERSAGRVTDQAAAVLRALARSNDGRFAGLVESFLLAAPLTPPWSAVPWALWPHSAGPFARLWARYFREAPVAAWRSTAIVQAFLPQAEALRAVRDVLRPQSLRSWTHLRESVLRQSASPWLSREARSRLERVCADAG